MTGQKVKILHIPTGSRAEVNCVGSESHNQTWSQRRELTHASSEDIILSETPSNKYQISNRGDDQQVLVFQNFSVMDVGTFTCRSNLTINNSRMQEIIFITNCES